MPSISLSSIESLRSPVGIAAHSNTSSTMDVQPASRTKCCALVNPTRFPLSELWNSQSITAIGNEKKRHAENVVDSHRRKGLTNHKIRPLPLPQIRTARTNTTRKCLLCTTPAQNSERKMSDLGDKLGRDGKLMAAERACHFANNLCLFCGGVGHTAKECPKSLSSAAKAKAALPK